MLNNYNLIYLSNKIVEILDTYKIGPYCARVSNEIEDDNESKGFDIHILISFIK